MICLFNTNRDVFWIRVWVLQYKGILSAVIHIRCYDYYLERYSGFDYPSSIDDDAS